VSSPKEKGKKLYETIRFFPANNERKRGKMTRKRKWLIIYYRNEYQIDFSLFLFSPTPKRRRRRRKKNSNHFDRRREFYVARWR
jgi:hypothetical protein